MTPNLDRDGYTVLPGAVPQDAVRAALRCIGLGIRRHGLPGGQGHADAQGGTFLPELRDDPAIWALLPADTVDTLLGATFEDEWAEPQILLRFPDEAPTHDCPWCSENHRPPRPALVPHVDEEPPWAGHDFTDGWRGRYGVGRGPCSRVWTRAGDGGECGKPASDPIHVRRRYRAIVGVALTDHGADDGALHVWVRSHIDGVGATAPIPVPLRAGDAVVLDPRLWHAGSLNLGHTARVMTYFRLLGAAS